MYLCVFAIKTIILDPGIIKLSSHLAWHVVSSPGIRCLSLHAPILMSLPRGRPAHCVYVFLSLMLFSPSRIASPLCEPHVARLHVPRFHTCLAAAPWLPDPKLIHQIVSMWAVKTSHLKPFGTGDCSIVAAEHGRYTMPHIVCIVMQVAALSGLLGLRCILAWGRASNDVVASNRPPRG